MGNIKILHKNCDLSIYNNRELPYNTYVVTYVEDGETCHDIVQPRKQLDIFDHYWDNYRDDFRPPWYQSEGRVNPKLWGNKPKEESKKKR
jgi:hypothetical protein